MEDLVKKHAAILAAGDAVKRAPQAEAAQDIARLKEHDVQTQEILQELVTRVLALEQLQLKPKRAKVRVAKVPKKRRHGGH
jgi:hypothetical protein